MNETIVIPIIVLSAVGILAAVILYFVAQKFKVIEDPRIDEVDAMLPGANCGGCGYPGCRKFAQVFVESDNVENLFCPVGGNEVMSQIAAHLGKTVAVQDKKVAVVRCDGNCDNTRKITSYDGPQSCRIAVSTFEGENGCSFGCVGYGDCVSVCAFDAIIIDEKTGLPVVTTDKCTACGKCVEICPRDIIELRKTNKKDLKIFVACMNKDKGVRAKKNCDVACIACTKCVQVCPHDAIVISNNLAYIDDEKCKLCRKCVVVCPTHAIHETNFPPRKVQEVVSEDRV